MEVYVKTQEERDALDKNKELRIIIQSPKGSGIIIEDTPSNWYVMFCPGFNDMSNWFQEVGERAVIYPDRLEQGYSINGVNVVEAQNISFDCRRGTYMLGWWFPTKEKAEQYLALKKHVASFKKSKPGDTINRFGFYDNGTDPKRAWEKNELREGSLSFVGGDFFMPLDAAQHELDERAKLLIAYYDLE